MCSVFHYFVYVFHLIKFVCLFFSFLFRCYRIFLVNKDIHNQGYTIKHEKQVKSLKWKENGVDKSEPLDARL